MPVEVELQHSQPSQAISNTRWRLEPGDPRDGLNNPSGVCCLSLQLFAVAVTGYERKPAPARSSPTQSSFQNTDTFEKALPALMGSVRLMAGACDPATDLPPLTGSELSWQIPQERVPAKAVTDLIDLHRARRGGIYCTWQYHAQALLMRGLKTANIDESCQ